MAKKLDQIGVVLEKLHSVKYPVMSEEKKDRLKDHLFAKINGEIDPDQPFLMSELAGKIAKVGEKTVPAKQQMAEVKEKVFDELESHPQSIFGRFLRPVSYFVLGFASVFALFLYSSSDESGINLDKITSFWAGLFDDTDINDTQDKRENIYLVSEDGKTYVIREGQEIDDLLASENFFFQPGDQVLTEDGSALISYFDSSLVNLKPNSVLSLDSWNQDFSAGYVESRLHQGAADFQMIKSDQYQYIVMADGYYFTSDSDADFGIEIRDNILEVSVDSNELYIFKDGQNDYLKAGKGTLVLEIDSSIDRDSVVPNDLNTPNLNVENNLPDSNNLMDDNIASDEFVDDNDGSLENSGAVNEVQSPVEDENSINNSDELVADNVNAEQGEADYARLLDLIVAEESDSEFEFVENNNSRSDSTIEVVKEVVGEGQVEDQPELNGNIDAENDSSPDEANVPENDDLVSELEDNALDDFSDNVDSTGNGDQLSNSVSPGGGDAPVVNNEPEEGDADFATGNEVNLNLDGDKVIHDADIPNTDLNIVDSENLVGDDPEISIQNEDENVIFDGPKTPVIESNHTIDVDDEEFHYYDVNLPQL